MSGKENDRVLIRLPRQAIDDIAYLIDHQELILPVAQQAASEHIAASIDGFSIRVATKLSKQPEIVIKLATALWNIKMIQDRTNQSSQDLGESLTRSLQVTSALIWKKAYQDRWQSFLPTLVSALDLLVADHPLLVSAKANTLAYTQQNLCLGSRIITDVCLVFNVAGDKILETVITNTMVVNYVNDANQNRRMVIALDLQDIIALRRQCERAEKKAQIITESLKGVGLNPILLPEEVDS